jgi:hypothetical protein
MKTHRIGALLVLCAAAHGDAREELAFARKLSARGHTEMAAVHLTKLSKSSDRKLARAGKYGLALLDRQNAQRMRNRFLGALQADSPPPMSRSEILRLYADAVGDVKSYVESAREHLDARFQYGELLQEYAEFLAGRNYPDRLDEERKKLAEENKSKVEKLFEEAISEFDAVYKALHEKIKKNPAASDEMILRRSTAEFHRGRAWLRRAMVQSNFVKRAYYLEQAIELLDEFQGKHFNELFGVYALIFLGKAFRELGTARGEEGDVGTGLDYFEACFKDPMKEDPQIPEQSKVMAEGFFWYADTCLLLALGPKYGPKAGKLKRGNRKFFDYAIKSGAIMDRKLVQGAKEPPALRARLLIAEAYAAKGNLNAAVNMVGGVLDTAKFSNLTSVMREASAKLSDWLGGASGVDLDPELLYQLGESLSAQGRGAPAVAAFEKAIASSKTDEEKEKYGYPAWRRIAGQYRRDGRYYAAVLAAMNLVDTYKREGGGDENSRLGQQASEACNTARICWKQIADATNRPADREEYRKIVGIFRDEFPGHPENSDRAYREAKEYFNEEDYEKARDAFKGISPSSPNYWAAQRIVPVALRALANKDKANKAKHLETCAQASLDLVALGQKSPGVAGAERAVQYGYLYNATALGDLEKWDEALAAIDAYMAKYPGQFLLRGKELDVKIRAHMAKGDLDKAEAALATFKKTLPSSIYLRSVAYDVFKALRKKYATLEPGAERAALATRCAALWQERVEDEKSPAASYLGLLGLLYKDAEMWGDAGDAYASAADLEREGGKDKRVIAGYTMQAARMQFEAAKQIKENDPRKYKAVVNKTRKLFQNVLVPIDPTGKSGVKSKAEQAAVFRTLGDGNKYPPRETFAKIKKFVEPLYVAAKVFGESSPEAGVDGRWVGIRLIDYIHTFTVPLVHEDMSVKDQKRFAPYVAFWWSSFELKLELCKNIAETTAGSVGKKAARAGYSMHKKYAWEIPDMDGPERVKRSKKLGLALKKLASG